MCRTIAGAKYCAEYPSVKQIITKARPSVFDFSYPIYNEEYRETLETKILRHYYMQEIGMETVGQWKLKLEDKLTLIMPYYNQLYESAALKVEPFNDVDYRRETENTATGNESAQNNSATATNGTTVVSGNNVDDVTHTGNDNKAIRYNETADMSKSGSSTNTGEEKRNDTKNATIKNTNNEQKRFSDTPQGGLTGIQNNKYLTTAEINDITDSKTDIEEDTTKATSSGESKSTETGKDTRTHAEENTTTNTYTDKRSATSNQNTTNTNSIEAHTTASGEHSTTEKFIEHVYGKTNNKSYASLLMELRDTYINIDLMIIDELQDLFMSVWE